MLEQLAGSRQPRPARREKFEVSRRFNFHYSICHFIHKSAVCRVYALRYVIDIVTSPSSQADPPRKRRVGLGPGVLLSL